MRQLAAKAPAALTVFMSAVWILMPAPQSAPQVAAPRAAVAQALTAAQADSFQFPLATWTKHCLGFGSQWRLCDGTALRTCSATGAVWRHTGFDVRTAIQPVRAAADGVIAGYIVDPTFRGGVLIRHQTASGIVITQYWHVWPRPGFRTGTHVSKGQVFADIADMGSRTHFHFAVFLGDYEPNAWRGALPASRCDGFPAFPYHFVDPTAFVQAHEAKPAAPQPQPHSHCRRFDNS